MVNDMSNKRFLTAKEVAELFEVSANTITRWAPARARCPP